MSKIIKSYIKKILKKLGWKLTKIYKNKSYTNATPDKSQVHAIIKIKRYHSYGCPQGNRGGCL